MKEKPEGCPTFTHLQDFQECGSVYRFLTSNPSASDSEVARATRLTKDRVESIRKYLEYEYGFSRPWWQHNPSYTSSDFSKVADEGSTSRFVTIDHKNEVINRLAEKVQNLKQAKEPNAVLELKEKYTVSQARDMYRKLAKEWAPDKIGYQNETKIWELSNKIMAKINNAYEAISGKYSLEEWHRTNLCS
jgi:hypothetical protein